MKDYRDIFEQRKNDSRYNTSYPLSPSDWAQYRTHGALAFPDKDISFYIHIPFCRHICAFCEYTRIICPNEEMQDNYLKGLKNDILNFVSSHGGHRLMGFDIGGGTPTALSVRNFSCLMRIFNEACDWMDISEDFEPSIEGTFQTLSETKLRMMSDCGIKRLSVGMQSSDDTVLRCGDRKNMSLEECVVKRRLVKECGIEKLNVDLMYGLKGQSLDSCRQDVEWIKVLDPEQVTLYEFRPNMSKGGANLSKEELFGLYSVLYDGITSLGYHGWFGANTFTKDACDRGLSSYLRTRMFDGIAYKGFGISAQSMSPVGVSYNIGKGRRNLSDIILSESFPEEFTYNLPPEEVLAKYVSIAAYSGEISVEAASRLLHADFLSAKADVAEWLIDAGLMEREDGKICITRKGFKHYGAVFSLMARD